MSTSGATDIDLTRLRAGAQLLHRPERLSVEELVRRLGAVQAQDVRAFPLALRARSEGLDAGAVDAEGVVRTWLMRGTLHLTPAEDVAWIRDLLAPRRAAATWRRLGQLGFDERSADRAVRVVEQALADGPLPRAAVSAALERAGLPCTGQAPVHVLGLAASRGVLVHGRGDTVVLAADRLPAAARTPTDPEAELARRHLASRAPARPEDFAAWSGLPLGAARAAWRELDLVEVGDHGWALNGHVPDPVPSDLVRLLPAFDELLLGWKGREHAVAPEHARAVFPGGGMLRATVTVGGRVAGTWTNVGVELFAPVPAEALDAELADVRRVRSPAGPSGSS
jgi:hypothetical protein